VKIIVAAITAASAILPTPTPTPTPPPSTKPTFCVEWVRQSRPGYERVTLFADGTAIWKTSDGEGDRVRRKTLPATEVEFYCSYFPRREFWALAEDLRTGLTSDFSGQSLVTLTRPDGTRKVIRFDDLSALSADAGTLRAALDGLKAAITNPLAPASRFTPDVLAAGTILKRFDGAIFRVIKLEKEKGFVEIVGVSEPYSQFVKIEELRFQFAAPE
jgi:hypothetical protein